MLRIRPYRPEELPAVIDRGVQTALQQLVQRDLPGATYEGVAGQVHKMFAYVLSMPDATVLVAEMAPDVAPGGAAPAGYALLMPQPNAFTGEREMVIMDLFTDPALRGRGLGKALVRQACEYARSIGCGGVVAQVALHNQASQATLRSAGFVGERVIVGLRLS
jgi:ribosomal protein S18 acetylase RimI-like enzyme